MDNNIQRDTPDPNEILGNPTKEFFISMLIKDITLRDAIGDLLDNSVDGAKRNANDPRDLAKFWIKIEADKTKFEIKDNCGGIESNIARDYAFRFGRPAKHKLDPDSIGQFGIGMKRAFFKIGEKIHVISKAKKSNFEMHIDVLDWKDPAKGWNFKFDQFQDVNISNSIDKTETSIIISQLSEDSKNSFDKDGFFNALKNEISKEHLYALNRGLNIFINGSKLKPTRLTIINDDEFKPAYWQHKFESGLNVEVYTGISLPVGEEGGWYIFCNERLVIGPDTSADTGWTGLKKGGVAEYHHQFHRFRGYVFFESKDASRLPWTTTKTAMDKDSSEFKFVRQKMIIMMGPVMSLMNQLKKEKEKNTPESERVLNNKLGKIEPVLISDVIIEKKKLKEVFSFPDPRKKIITVGDGKIRYSRPYSKIDKVKAKLGVTTLEEVGGLTFDYYYSNEIGE
jgi:hypothetical protein